MEEKNPIVFISYSHDDKRQLERVFDLSKKLRSEGIDCILDQYEESPPEGWPRWMQRSIKKADYVIMVCTPIYYSRVMGYEEKGKGHGVAWEGNLIYQELYDNGSLNNKFIPVIFNDGSRDDVPDPLKGSTSYNVEDVTEYENLYRRLRGVGKEKPALGKLRILEEKPRKTMFLSGLINPHQWELANWTAGVTYLYTEDHSKPPMMTVLFEDKEEGIKIFENWIDLIGREDELEQLRVSIVTGDVPNQPFGYFISIGENVENAKKRIDSKTEGIEIEYLMTNARIHRMVPKDLTNLNRFRSEVERFGFYYIVPAKQFIHPEKGRGWEIEMDYKIMKREIEFREYDEIPDEGDYDSLLKTKEVQNWKF